jgi:hypothetical protein
VGFVPCSAGSQPLPNDIRLFANQFYIEHRGIIGSGHGRARRIETAVI